MMETPPPASLAPLRGRPARLPRIDDSNERYERPRNPFDRELAPRPGRIAAHVVVPGTPATYANRAALRTIGLRWDSAGNRWHGAKTAGRVRELRERLGPEVRCFGMLETSPKGPAAPKPALPRPSLVPTAIAVCGRDRGPRPRPLDGARTCFESRVAFPGPGDVSAETVTPARRFTVFEVTSGLPEDSREEDERAEARRLRYLRGRVKAARSVVSHTPGLAGVLTNDWMKAALNLARFGITEAMFRNGVSVGDATGERIADAIWRPMNFFTEVREQIGVVLPSP
jgi:hypothetical protein